MIYSQNDEQTHILNYFGNETGKFVDIGAYDVYRFSNTRALYERGWSGVLVEPAPGNYKGIANHYKDEPRIKVLNIAVGEPAGMVDFYESADAVSTTSEEHMRKWAAAGVAFTKISVPQMGVAQFAEEHCHGVDFLSIDTEGINMTVFRSLPDWVLRQVKMLCIEHDGGHQEVEERLRAFGFKQIAFNAENIIVAK